ncbi:SAV_6107 family HEPN domain-containing protein [Pseudonocardia alni]|uniref:SAV_6107 family HEPN domain-containing protein n=1 Tax=Pseudonocardia alni TaxID=33907 RepID=UPI0026F4223C|nr:SAV_6107 family HEPN domain-containing protein [Pseudonocardia sp. AL041005-10]
MELDLALPSPRSAGARRPGDAPAGAARPEQRSGRVRPVADGLWPLDCGAARGAGRGTADRTGAAAGAAPSRRGSGRTGADPDGTGCTGRPGRAGETGAAGRSGQVMPLPGASVPVDGGAGLRTGSTARSAGGTARPAGSAAGSDGGAAGSDGGAARPAGPVPLRSPAPAPPSRDALGLLRQAAEQLAEAHRETEPLRRYPAAYLAALRAGAAVLAMRARPRTRRGAPRDVWRLLAEVAPELEEWAAFFAGCSRLRIEAEAGIGRHVDRRAADDLLRQAEQFVTRVQLLLPR